MPLIPLAWHHLQFEVPDAWEVIGFKKNPGDGQLVLSDRHGETMQVFWRRFKKEPLLRRRLVELVKSAADDEMKESAIRSCIRPIGGWDVFCPEEDDLPTFAARQLEAGVLLAVAFPPHPEVDRECIAQVLSSYRPNESDEPVWGAFGMHFAMPRQFRLSSVDAFPARQIMRFENRRHESVTLHRYGMLSLVLEKDDMATFFARLKGKRFMLRREGEFKKDGKHAGVILSYTTRGSGQSPFGTLLARTWHGRVWIWRRDDIERLYCVDHHARPKNLAHDFIEKVWH